MNAVLDRPLQEKLTKEEPSQQEPKAYALENLTDRYQVSVNEYIKFKRDGFLVVKNLVSPAEIAELRRHTDDLMQGRLPEQTRQMNSGDKPEQGVAVQGLDAPPAHLSPEEKCSISCGFICCTGSWNCMSGTCCTRAFWTCWKC